MPIFCETKDKQSIVLNEDSGHASTHLSDTPELEGLVKELMQNRTGLCSELEVIEVDMGRILGESDLIETEEDDEIFYAKRLNRETYTRFCKNRRPSPSSVVTIHLRKLDEDTYVLVTAFIGKDAPPFPGGENERPGCREFWSRHALAWGRQEIVPSTETSECPW